MQVVIQQFANTPEPEFPGHLILEQYQAQVGLIIWRHVDLYDFYYMSRTLLISLVSALTLLRLKGKTHMQICKYT